jgi:hypothetical protein
MPELFKILLFLKLKAWAWDSSTSRGLCVSSSFKLRIRIRACFSLLTSLGSTSLLLFLYICVTLFMLKISCYSFITCSALRILRLICQISKSRASAFIFKKFVIVSPWESVSSLSLRSSTSTLLLSCRPEKSYLRLSLSFRWHP